MNATNKRKVAYKCAYAVGNVDEILNMVPEEFIRLLEKKKNKATRTKKTLKVSDKSAGHSLKVYSDGKPARCRWKVNPDGSTVFCGYLSENDEIIVKERRLRELIDAEIKAKKENGFPVALYDDAQKRPYLEYPDGRRVY